MKKTSKNLAANASKNLTSQNLAANASKTEEKIIEMLSTHLGVDVEDITPEDTFADDLRMNSVSLSDFGYLLENRGFSITPEEIAEFNTVGELIDYIIQEDGEGE